MSFKLFWGALMPVNLNEANFKSEVLQSPAPVLVDFGAEWCAPCKRLDPILEQLSARWNGRVRVVRVDVDENSSLAMQMQVMSVPTLILFVNGSEALRLVGLQSQEKIEAKINAVVG